MALTWTGTPPIVPPTDGGGGTGTGAPAGSAVPDQAAAFLDEWLRVLFGPAGSYLPPGSFSGLVSGEGGIFGGLWRLMQASAVNLIGVVVVVFGFWLLLGPEGQTAVKRGTKAAVKAGAKAAVV